MADEREERIRARAHRIWEEQGRPEGRAEEHWREAERQESGSGGHADRLPAPDDRQTAGQDGPPADPLRNPEPGSLA